MRVRRLLVPVVVVVLVVAAGCSGDGDDDPGAGSTTTEIPRGTVVGEGDRYEATIRRDAAGVPHIVAADMEGAAFGQGWASAQDRPCDLIDQIIKIKGERARWFGAGPDDENVASDLAWRAIGIHERAVADWEGASDEVRTLMAAFVAGWNGQLVEVGPDGVADWCAGQEWLAPVEPEDVYAYARAITLQASSGAVADMLGSAQPPGAVGGDGEEAAAPAAGPGVDGAPLASNGWAIGAERSADGGGMLVANPHFPWEGELRFWEVHLTVPGELDVYGVQLSGLPGIGIGFTETFGWTHTVSAGNRFTAYTLDLVPGAPTTYRYGDEEREMSSTEVTIEVRGDDGEVTEEQHTQWSTHYGPVLDFPGVGWTPEQAITLRDANLENDEFVEQYLAMMQADDLDELVAVHRDVGGVPLFNTIATSADGRAWYADTSATPALSDEAIAAYEASLESDFIVAAAADAGAIVLDGSDPTNEWEEREGARDPGLVPFDEMPVLERDDYVFNANDSFWVAHATALLDGDFSPLHGRMGTARSPRTRENAVVLDDTSTEGPSGADGAFTLDELAAAALQNRGYTSRALLGAVVERCTGAGPVEGVDLAEACAALGEWDGTYDLDSVGAVLWRELVAGVASEDLTAAGELWAEDFDPADPIGTPSGLAPAPDGGVDPVLADLAAAVRRLEAAGLAVDVPLGEVQVADRNGTLVPIHGGTGRDGTTNIVQWGGSGTTRDPALAEVERETVDDDSTLAEVTGSGADGLGYRINYGTSFLMALAFGADGPEARVFLTYGNQADREDPRYLAATEAFSEKAWRTVAFTPEAVEEAAVETTTVRG